MNQLRYTLLFLILYLSFGFSGLAQLSNAQIRGFVYAPDNQPAVYSTIVLLNQDTVVVKGTFSLDDGSFMIDRIAPGNYYVQVRNLEFANYLSEQIRIGQNESIQLEPISLSPATTQLSEVVVTARKALVEVHADKMVFNVSSSINASGNSGLELLGKSPGVIVDMDNNIILQGKSGVQVFVNGRPTRLSGNDLTNFLESLRSENIESIEIITNPSSKYDAEGTAGIINILLKKNVKLGFNGSLTGSYVQGIYARANAGVSLSYSGEKISVFSNINVLDNTWMDNFRETNFQNGYLLEKKANGLNNRKGYNISAGIDYSIDERQSLSLDGRVFINNRNDRLQSSTGIFDASNPGVGEILNARALDENPTENYNLNMNYRYVFNQRSNLSTDLSYGHFVSDKNTWQPNEYLDATGDTILRVFNKEFDANTKIDLWSAKIDFEKKLDIITFTTGAKYAYITTGNQLAFYNIENEVPMLDINRSNDFTYLEKVAAVYAMINVKPSDKITINAGLRMENTSSVGELESEVPTQDSRVARSYNDFFPNIGLSWDSKKNSVISLNYGRRITRPNYQDLNPFESRVSELSAWKGNPFLNPNYITNYQLTYSFKRKLVISNNYSITRDFFATIFEISDEKGNVLIPRNMQKSTNNSLSVSYPLTVTKWWEFSSFATYAYATYKGEHENTVIDLEVNQYNFRFQNNLRLPGGLAMELTYNLWSPWIWRGSVEVEGSYSVNVGLRKDFFDRRLLVQLTGNDIFRSSSDYFYKSNYGGMDVDGVRIFDNRRVGINVTYNFGNQQTKNRKRSRSAIDEELNRISE